ncbi:hypothetical protein C7428_2861 [Pantoea ananatis]|jgi:hypothetical protein|nr:hypothetical protein C7428_2861 [Pantoea ananatis]
MKKLLTSQCINKWGAGQLDNGMQVTSAGVKTIDRVFFAILSFISSRISVHPTFANSKQANC